MKTPLRPWLASIGVALAIGCGGQAARPTTASPTATEGVATAASPSCQTVQHRQFDFWLGEWDLVVKARAAPGGPFQEARGRQRITSILGGCAISEDFVAEGPGQPWAGRSFSMWQAGSGVWRQTWVDDSGNYLAFTGGIEDGAMTLYGEPRERDGKKVQMRMRFLDVSNNSLRWEWQRQEDGGAWEPQMLAAYTRRK